MYVSVCMGVCMGVCMEREKGRDKVRERNGEDSMSTRWTIVHKNGGHLLRPSK